MAKLYMMFGYPGAGKTTTSQAIARLTGAQHLQSDRVRLELFPEPAFSQDEHSTLYTTLDNRTEQLLREGKDVIYDANLNRRQHRQDKYDICERTGATPVLVWVQTEKNLSRVRAMDDSRKRLWPPDETPNQVFDRVAEALQEPDSDEPYVIIDGTKISDDYIKNVLGL